MSWIDDAAWWIREWNGDRKKIGFGYLHDISQGSPKHPAQFRIRRFIQMELNSSKNSVHLTDSVPTSYSKQV